MNYAILIPAYNEEHTIEGIVRQARALCDTVIVVVDGATDGTIPIVRRMGGVHLIINHRNKGLAYSMKRGFRYALHKGLEGIVKLDGDGQMQLHMVQKLVDTAMRTGADIVCATCNDDTPWMIKKDIWLYSWLFRIATRIQLDDIVSEFRFLSRKAMAMFVQSRIKPHASNIAIIHLVKHGCSCVQVDGGVDYSSSKDRPAYLGILLDCRIQFIKALLAYGTIRSVCMAIFSIPILLLLFLFNVTVGWKYNSILPRRKVRT